jgi:lipopolysaccharide/colanic/teichoic acid biosynthesis glycosyltransferase
MKGNNMSNQNDTHHWLGSANHKLPSYEIHIPFHLKPSAGYIVGKRIIDILLSGVSMVLLSPVMLTIAILISRDGGPVLFKQERVGQDGHHFYMYKFRTMRTDAEHVLRSDHELWTKYVANGYKLSQEEDPRITKVGRFLRKTSLDELPQFINVLKDEMSLVGPRPVIREELDSEYGEHQHHFVKMKPGVTGPWGISGRSDLTYPERAAVELSYLAKRSIRYDLYALWMTFYQVVSPRVDNAQ